VSVLESPQGGDFCLYDVSELAALHQDLRLLCCDVVMLQEEEKRREDDGVRWSRMKKNGEQYGEQYGD
jgi:hypothetical protein